MSDITIAELVRNGTLSAEMAAVLWSAVDDRLSFLTVALPRFAGKSTTSEAVLALRPEGMPVHRVAGEAHVMERLKRERLGGYIKVEEFSRAPVPGYIWGEPVHRVFDTLSAGYALQTCLHADGVEAGMREVTQGNQISDEQASTFKLVVYIERFGDADKGYWRRVTDLYEVHAVENGLPVGHSLFRWRPEQDDFERLSGPHQFGRDTANMEERAGLINELAASGQTSAQAVGESVSSYRSRQAAGNA